jgi:hypothetical protein
MGARPKLNGHSVDKAWSGAKPKTRHIRVGNDFLEKKRITQINQIQATLQVGNSPGVHNQVFKIEKLLTSQEFVGKALNNKNVA